jgi:c-di-AMP phosphodiesterase-like protein
VDLLSSNDIKKVIDDETLLIIVDTNKKERIQNEELFNLIKNKIIIDHHIKDDNDKYKLSYEYINSDESSSSEIVIDLINDLNIYIPDYIASIMLAGVIIDTDNFYLKTGENTFEIAGTLKKFGADTTEIQYLLKQDYNEYIDRQKIIINTEFIDNIGVALGSTMKIYENEELAKAADTILMFNNVEASFVIGYIDDDEIGISARSLGKIDVQKIMKRLDGGGHKTDAATQLKGIDLDQARDKLIISINKNTQ